MMSPPFSGVIEPVCTAATQIVESRVYTSVPQIVLLASPSPGQFTTIGSVKSSGIPFQTVFQEMLPGSPSCTKLYE